VLLDVRSAAGSSARRAPVLRLQPRPDGHARRPVEAPQRTRLLDLPEPTPGGWLIVSSRIAEPCPDRDDLVFPDEQVRIDGRIDDCRLLRRVRPLRFPSGRQREPDGDSGLVS
jgi:hypothetical protein